MKRILILICLLLIIGCTKDRAYFEKFRNPNLKYNWAFNDSIKGGHTYNSTYFEIEKRGLFREIFPLEINFKHEEGHIYTLQLLNIENIDAFEAQQSNYLNISNKHSFRQYIISVSEGIADYYSITYFDNESSKKYVKFLEENKDNNMNGHKQHYQGLRYVNNSLEAGLYKNLEELILDFGSEKQYISYINYLNSIKQTPSLKTS